MTNSDALLGTTPALLADGVPDAAFKEIEGDNKAYGTGIRKLNKIERGGQTALYFDETQEDTAELRRLREALLNTTADDVDQIRSQALRWSDYELSQELRRQRLHADAWSAAFVWPLIDGTPEPPTDDVVRRIAQNPDASSLTATVAEVERLANEYRFFHWHLEFPEIFGDLSSAEVGPEGWPGGFDCMLGNPPWERVKLQEQEFFAARDPEIATAPNAAARQRLINQLQQTDPALYSDFLAERRRAEGQSLVLRTSGRYPLNGRGDVNTYAVFAELFRSLTGPKGRSGVIVPTGIATDATTQYFFKDLVTTETLAALYDFENAAPIFEGVHRSFKFCLLTTTGRADREDAASFAFFLRDPLDISVSEFALTPAEITLLNPNTGNVPIFRTRRDAEITLGVYRHVPVLINNNEVVNGNPWRLTYSTMFHMSNDSYLFKTREQLEVDGWTSRGNIFERGQERMLPLYEGRMGHQFTHRFASLEVGEERAVTDAELKNPMFSVFPQYWVAELQVSKRLQRRTWGSCGGMLGHRRVARNNDERTCIATIVPWGAASYGWILSSGPSAPDLCFLLTIFDSFAYDYLLRGSFSQPSLPQSTSEQIPVPLPGWEHTFPTVFGKTDPQKWIISRVLELVHNAWDLQAFATDLGDEGAPFKWNQARRTCIRAELDAAVFHLYGILRDDVIYIMDTFTISRRKDMAACGEYRTKRVILEIFDAMQRSIDSGEPYQTILDPPPGKGARHPMKEHA